MAHSTFSEIGSDLENLMLTVTIENPRERSVSCTVQVELWAVDLYSITRHSVCARMKTEGREREKIPPEQKTLSNSLQRRYTAFVIPYSS